MTRPLAAALLDPGPSARALPWAEFLKTKINMGWRPGEFDPERLLFVPDPTNVGTSMSTCVREGCTVLLNQGRVCPACRTEHRRSGSPLALDDWLVQAGPKVSRDARMHCEVERCERTHDRYGLCNAHAQTYRSWRRRVDDPTIHLWISLEHPEPFPAKRSCLVEYCERDSLLHDLCRTHANAFRQWQKRAEHHLVPPTRDGYLSTQVEPLLDVSTGATYRSNNVTPFALLPEPLRWEFLYAIQQRDKTGVMLFSRHMRSTYLELRERGIDTVVGASMFHREVPGHYRPTFSEWQRHVDAAYREWSGIDDRDKRLIYLEELNLRKGSTRIGPNATYDLRSIEQDWIVDALRAWLFTTQRAYAEAMTFRWAWVLAADVLAVRGTPVQALGREDVEAIAKVFRERWESTSHQRSALRALKRLMDFAKDDERFADTWGKIPPRFEIDPSRLVPRATPSNHAARDADEPFRFVPQPVIEHLMNHLHLVRRRTPYLTAEVRIMLFVHERCGRRTGETLRLKDDCITYDDAGSPYLEWRRGKPPYTWGKRLPIHQETHDAIREWQKIKAEHGVSSEWLFPSVKSHRDVHWGPQYLGDRLDDLISAVQQHAPFTDAVEGADGNLIHFDLNSIDPYSFRHAFAQRFADATDAEGRSTTPPDVLQDYMGHRNFTTTGIYYEVSTKRRKKALSAVAPRRLNILGEPIAVDQERDGFTKVSVSLGHCAEPQNVASHGHGCLVEHACESCPFFLVDPLERDSMDAKRQAIRIRLERARAINARQHLLEHYQSRIDDCTRIIEGIDRYVENLPVEEQEAIRSALRSMSEVRRMSTAPRAIDLRSLPLEEGDDR